MFGKLCAPAMFYIVIAVIKVLMAFIWARQFVTKGSVAWTIVGTAVFTYVVQRLCANKYNKIAWGIVIGVNLVFLYNFIAGFAQGFAKGFNEKEQ